MMIALVGFQGALEAQETIISKKDADFVFSLTRPEWEKNARKFLLLVGL
jgi:hypothetical protein